MKKSAIFAATATLALTAGIITYSARPDEPQLTETEMANVEALVWDEWGFDGNCQTDGKGCVLHDGIYRPNEKGDYPDD